MTETAEVATKETGNWQVMSASGHEAELHKPGGPNYVIIKFEPDNFSGSLVWTRESQPGKSKGDIRIQFNGPKFAPYCYEERDHLPVPFDSEETTRLLGILDETKGALTEAGFEGHTLAKLRSAIVTEGSIQKGREALEQFYVDTTMSSRKLGPLYDKLSERIKEGVLPAQEDRALKTLAEVNSAFTTPEIWRKREAEKRRKISNKL